MASKIRKIEHAEHILLRPDFYIGSVTSQEQKMWVGVCNPHNPHEERFSFETVMYNQGFDKTFDEILVNAYDHAIRTRGGDQPVKTIKVKVNAETGEISVDNDGQGIPIEMTDFGCHTPELIFGTLLTSSNYDDKEERLTAGRNDYGAKLTNLFSKKFVVECLSVGQKYVQSWSDNMSKKEKPTITKVKGKPYTCVSWIPDYERFGFADVSVMIPQLRKRVIDMATTLGKNVKVYWNDELVKTNDLAKYARLYLGDDAPIVHEVLHDRCEIVVADNPLKKFMQVSFVNGNLTSNGGTHVNLLLKPVVDHLAEMVNKKRKTKDVNETLVENSLALFIRCDIVNPAFSGQMKETLKTRPKDYGWAWGANPHSAPLDEKILKKIGTKLSVVTNILEGMEAKDSKDAKKTDGKMTSVIRGLPKLDDALLAGTKDSAKCTLILTEGDSAKAMVLSGLSKDQRKTFGVYPLKGKIMNVKDVTSDKIHNNEEITALKKILGLETGKTYSSVAGLRYGSVMFMTDQDLDGSHIRGLGINLFHSLWKGLLQIPGFLTYMATPIVKATKGKTVKTFYTLQDYEAWKDSLKAGQSPSVKYYKGLGTANRVEAQEYFKDMNIAKFTWDNGSDSAVDLAFNKKKANDRKDWLLAYDSSKILNGKKEVPYIEFVHNDLIHFSYYDLIRSIPNVMDGLKVSQRKILYAGFKRNLVKEIRVAQFAGYVSEHTGYLHGEASLNGAIVGLAQDFVGSNNLNLFMPNGQFGTRLAGGDDHASPRYIHTELNPMCEYLFPKSDFDVLDYEDDDGTLVEPKWYAPVIPMILVNGANGIGTGFSTTIPCYDPKEVLEYVKDSLLGIEDEKWDPLPWYKGFNGEIRKNGTSGYEFEGNWSMKDNKKLTVTKLPIGVWTSKYKEHLEKLVDLDVVKSYQDTSTDMTVNFEIKLGDMSKAKGVSSRMMNRMPDQWELIPERSLSSSSKRSLPTCTSLGLTARLSSVQVPKRLWTCTCPLVWISIPRGESSRFRDWRNLLLDTRQL
jgi:DNA topoisomerase-2